MERMFENLIWAEVPPPEAQQVNKNRRKGTEKGREKNGS